MRSGQCGKTPGGNVDHGAIGIEIDRQRRRNISSYAGSGTLFVKKTALFRLFLELDQQPLAAAGCGLMMMGWTQGRQYSDRGIGDQLRDVGPALVLPSLGYFSIVTAQKPRA
ncbi:TPA: hypothetical protein ACKQGF_004833 [Serratia marcescens]|uniref:hypothetical protein n=1 Tax=Serratia marcescens TaxID=615 RepID=UPI001FAFA1CE|nr:hypothetical protein [Serratia marcescens]